MTTQWITIFAGAGIIISVLNLPVLLVIAYTWRASTRMWKSQEASRRALTLALLAVKNQPGAAEHFAQVIASADEEERRQDVDEEFDDGNLA